MSAPARPSRSSHRVTLSPAEYRAWRDYRALTTESRRHLRALAHALRVAEAAVPTRKAGAR